MKRRQYAFAITAVVRDDELSESIEMPIFRKPYWSLPTSQVHEAFKSFLESIQEPEMMADAKEMLKNLASSINKEHAMAHEFTRIERKQRKK